MLRRLNQNQAFFIALLAEAARLRRDELLRNVPEGALSDTKSCRGEHNPTASLGFEPLPPDAEQLAALRDAIAALTVGGREELFALARVGQGDLAPRDWKRGLADAAFLGEQAGAVLLDDPDLHDHLLKGLYAVKGA
jgi:hypothetical protein